MHVALAIGSGDCEISEQAVELDGIPRHVADCRPSHADSLRSGAEDDSDDGAESEDGDDTSGVSGSEGEEEERRGVRTPWEGRLRQNVQPPDRFVPS